MQRTWNGVLSLVLSTSVFSMRVSRLSQIGITTDNPAPPWTKNKPLCYATRSLTKKHVCGSEFRNYKQSATNNYTHWDNFKDLKHFRVGDRVQAKREGLWYEGVIEKLPTSDPEQKGRYEIQLDDSPGEILFTADLRPTAAKVQTLGFFDIKSDEKYVVELAKESSGKADALFGAVFGATVKALGTAVGTVVPLGGIMTELLVDTISIMLTPDNLKKQQKLDLTSLFEKFELRLGLLDLGNSIVEIQRTYAQFLQWLQELLDLDMAPTELEYQERTVFMIESHLDVARVLFTQQMNVEAGLASYYLFEPLLQQALLHQAVMLMHVGIFQQMGKHKEALVHVSRAKKRYDRYRQLLSHMQHKLITFRELQVKVGDVSILELSNSTWRKGKYMCTEKWKHSSGYKRNMHDVEVTYSWADAFEKVGGIPTLERSRSFSILRTHGTMIAGSYSGDECNWYGVWTDGRDMLEEPEAYAVALRTQLEHYTDGLLGVLDASWLKLPGNDCLEGFELHSLKDVADCACQSAGDESLSRQLKEYFGPLSQSGTWPGQQPVLIAERYVVCERGRDHAAPVRDGNLCAKFL